MICYKVVSVLDNEDLGSAMVYPSSLFFRKYGPEIIVDNGMVFKNLDYARNFALKFVDSYDLQIWKCNCSNPRKLTWILDIFEYMDHTFIDFWNTKNRGRFPKAYCAPVGTYHARNIQLTERIF